MTTDEQAMPHVLAWPLSEAMAELERAGLRVIVREVSLPGHLPVGSELRVVRAKAARGVVELVAAKVRTEPVGMVPPK
ncbi:MAG: hypothetical protein ACOX2T_08025 [bacterium]|jgi:hypothetical protein